jgi:HEPN domain-containing protein
MAIPRGKDARRFYRAAFMRFDEAEFLLERSDFTTAAVYLAGYAIECIFKALMISSEPASEHPATLKTFRSAAAPDYDWLRERLAERHIRLPADAAKELTEVNWWTTSLRYEPRVIRRQEAEKLLAAAEKVVRWADGRL